MPIGKKIKLRSVGPHTFERLDDQGKGMGPDYQLDSDDVQWTCPKCKSQYNEAGYICDCGEESPYEVVNSTNTTPAKTAPGKNPEIGRNVRNIMHQLRSSSVTDTLDNVADSLEARGLIKEAYELDKIADAIEKCYS